MRRFTLQSVGSTISRRRLARASRAVRGDRGAVGDSARSVAGWVAVAIDAGMALGVQGAGSGSEAVNAAVWVWTASDTISACLLSNSSQKRPIPARAVMELRTRSRDRRDMWPEKIMNRVITRAPGSIQEIAALMDRRDRISLADPIQWSGDTGWVSHRRDSRMRLTSAWQSVPSVPSLGP